MGKAHQHGMASVAEEDDATLGVHPGIERGTVHEAPLEGRIDVCEELLDPARVQVSRRKQYRSGWEQVRTLAQNP